MNVFLPESTAEDSVKCLDDRRLNKQILEIVTLMDDHKGYNNHPVKVFYKDKKKFLANYGHCCCCEYSYRFRKAHKYTAYFCAMLKVYGQSPVYEAISKAVYVAGSKGSSDCVRETGLSKVKELFRQKLTTKWNNDKFPPRWTNRNPPEWYNKEEI